MKLFNKQYLLYLLKRHMTLIAVYTVILFVVLTLFGLSLQMQSYGDGSIVIIFIRSTSTLIGMGLSAIVPIYFMSFLYKKTSSDTYFALPYKKEDLWKDHMIFQYLALAIPLLIIILITYFTMMMGGIAVGVNDLIWMILLFVFMLIQQAISSLVCIKCNNMIDAIVACIAYFLLPIILFGAITMFLNTHINQAMLGSGYGLNELPFYSSLEYIISPFINIALTAISYYTQNDFIAIEAIVCDIIWIILGVIIIKYMRNCFINRKGENCETNTKSFIIYPLMIFIIVFMMILNVSPLQDAFSFFMMSAMSAIIFVLLIFFANRRIAIKPKYVLAFAIIYISTIGFSYAFDATNCFNLVHEIPNVDNRSVSKMYIEIKDGSYFKEYSYHGAVMVDLECMKEAHQKVIDSLKKKENYDYQRNKSFDASNIRIRYVMSNGDVYFRYYCVPILTRRKIDNMLNDNGIYLSYTTTIY